MCVGIHLTKDTPLSNYFKSKSLWYFKGKTYTKDIWIFTLRRPGINHVAGSTSAGTYVQGPAKLGSRPPTAPQVVLTHSPPPSPSILHSPLILSIGILTFQNRLLRCLIGFPPNPPPFEVQNIHQLTSLHGHRFLGIRCQRAGCSRIAWRARGQSWRRTTRQPMRGASGYLRTRRGA